MRRENFTILKSLIKIKTLVISALEKEVKKMSDVEIADHIRGIIDTIKSENKILNKIIKTEKIE